MSGESPFLLFRVECPVCKTINEFEQVKVGAYVEGDRDTDFCPRDIEWRLPRYQGYNPLVFFTATCGNCYYTREFTNKYKDWKNDSAFRTRQLTTVKTKHLEQLSVADSVIKMLGDAIDSQRHPNESAILKLHLAIFDSLLSEHPSVLDIGRFYLRIAWVFRYLHRAVDSGHARLSGQVRDAEEKGRQLQELVERARKQLDNLAGAVSAHFDESQVSADLQSRMVTYRERYEDLLKQLESDIAAIEQHHDAFRVLLHEYREAVVGDLEGEKAEAFGQYRSFPEFLVKLQEHWNGVVSGEREALEQAISYYKKAFTSGHEIAAGNQQIQASYLIAELSRRIGDYDGAKQYFTSTIRAGQDFIYQNRHDQSRTVLARKILELAIEQGRANLEAARTV